MNRIARHAWKIHQSLQFGWAYEEAWQTRTPREAVHMRPRVYVRRSLRWRSNPELSVWGEWSILSGYRGWDIDDLDVPDLEGVEQSKSVNTRNSDEVKPMLAHDTPPDSPTLHLAFQLATTDRAQLGRLKQYSQHIKRPQHKVQTKTSKLQDRSFSVWVTPNSSDAGQNRASQQHQRAVKPLAHSAIERQ